MIRAGIPGSPQHRAALPAPRPCLQGPLQPAARHHNPPDPHSHRQTAPQSRECDSPRKARRGQGSPRSTVPRLSRRDPAPSAATRWPAPRPRPSWPWRLIRASTARDAWLLTGGWRSRIRRRVRPEPRSASATGQVQRRSAQAQRRDGSLPGQSHHAAAEGYPHSQGKRWPMRGRRTPRRSRADALCLARQARWTPVLLAGHRLLPQEEGNPCRQAPRARAVQA